jgi:hypothetical protein
MDFDKRDDRKLKNIINSLKKLDLKYTHVFTSVLKELENAKNICEGNKE